MSDREMAVFGQLGHVFKLERFLLTCQKRFSIMTTRSTSTTLILAFFLIITFPFWMAAIGLLLGLAGGLFGIFVGVFAALFAGIITLIALPFKLLFGCFHMNIFLWLALFIGIYMLVRKKK